LTGTPLQNNVNELFSLLSFLEPSRFASSESFLADFGVLESEVQVDKLKAVSKMKFVSIIKIIIYLFFHFIISSPYIIKAQGDSSNWLPDKKLLHTHLHQL